VLAYVFGERKNKVFVELKSLLMPFGIKHFYADDWGIYESKTPEYQHTISKSNTDS
jgi:insertion element IS1 protein InsB